MAGDRSGHVNINLDIVRRGDVLVFMEGGNERVFRGAILMTLCTALEERVPGCGAPPVRNALPCPLNQLGAMRIKLEFHSTTITGFLDGFRHFGPLVLTLPLLPPHRTRRSRIWAFAEDISRQSQHIACFVRNLSVSVMWKVVGR